MYKYAGSTQNGLRKFDRLTLPDVFEKMKTSYKVILFLVVVAGTLSRKLAIYNVNSIILRKLTLIFVLLKNDLNRSEISS